MNISNINNKNVNAANIYAEANKRLGLEKAEKNGKQNGYLDSGFEKGGVSISREAKNMNVIDFVTDRVKTDMNADISADRVSRLKVLVQSGNYRVSTDALVSALIEGIGSRA